MLLMSLHVSESVVCDSRQFLFGFILFKFIRIDCEFRYFVWGAAHDTRKQLFAWSTEWNTAVRLNKPVQVGCECVSVFSSLRLRCVRVHEQWQRENEWVTEWVNESEVCRWKRANWKSIFVFTWKSLLITMYSKYFSHLTLYIFLCPWCWDFR